MSKFPPSDTHWHYRIKFEASLGLGDIWVDSMTLDYLNSFRENIFVSQAFPTPVTIPLQPQANRESAGW